MSSTFTRNSAPFGPGQLAPSGSLEDETLLKRLRGYKKAISYRYRIVRPDQIEASLLPGKLWITPKVDGELWFLVKRRGDVALCSYDGRVLQGVPVTDEAERALLKAGDIIIAGELHLQAGSARPRVHNVLRAFEDPRLAHMLRFSAFDLISEGDEDWQRRTWEERLGRMGELVGAGLNVSVVPVAPAMDPSAVVARYHEWVATDKAEGMVVRDEYDVIYKIKPTITLDAVVVAFGEKVDESGARVSELILALRRDEGYLQLLGSVSKGMREHDRAVWHRRLMEMVVPSTHMIASSHGTLCRFVRPEIVVEVTCSDLRAETTRTGQILTRVLDFDGVDGWRPVGQMPLARLKNPELARERPDKLPDVANIGLEQVYALTPFGGRRDIALPTSLPESTVVRRGVYTKTSSDQTSVRKFVAIKTNKDRLDDSYPAYVTHFTDFSPGRAEPLKTSIEVASNLSNQAQQIEAWITANIKRGWSEVTS